MEEALNSDNLDLISELAHKMLPPGKHIGATELCNTLKKIEENIKNKMEPESLRRLIRESEHEFDAVSYLIDMHIAKIS
jgi:tRNA A37 N6-isopentenylltransferase MiaA